MTISADSAARLKAAVRKTDSDLFSAATYINGSDTLPYRLLSPLSAAPGDVYPLVLVLHGSGVEGTDNKSQLGVLAKSFAQADQRRRWPAYVVVPQFPRRSSNYKKDPDTNVLYSVPDTCLSLALQLIDSLKKLLPVDAKRVYITGFSMGASSTINALEMRPDLFAAAVAISGIPSFGQLQNIAKTPLLIVHGNADTENPIASDQLLYKKLRRINKRNIQFWEIDGLAHDVFPPLYTLHTLERWLYQHQRK